MEPETFKRAADGLADELAAMTLDEVRVFARALADALTDWPATHQALVDGLEASR